MARARPARHRSIGGPDWDRHRLKSLADRRKHAPLARLEQLQWLAPLKWLAPLQWLAPHQWLAPLHQEPAVDPASPAVGGPNLRPRSVAGLYHQLQPRGEDGGR